MSLQNKIRQELPIEAKKAVLKDKLEEAIKNLHLNLKEIESTKLKLAELGISKDIPVELRKSIETEIRPKYLIQDELSKQKSYLTIQTSIAAIASTTIPGDLGNFIGFGIILLAIPLILKIYQNTKMSQGIDKNLIEKQMKILRRIVLLLIISIICSFILFFGLFIGYCIFSENGYDCEKEKVIFKVIGIIGLIFSLFGTIVGIIKLRKIK